MINNKEIKWEINNYRTFLIYLTIITLFFGLVFLYIAINFFQSNIVIDIVVNSIFFIMALITLIISIASFIIFCIAPTHIGFSNDCLYWKYKRYPKNNERIAFLRWKDIIYIKQRVSYISEWPIYSDSDLLYEKIKNPIRGSLIIYTRDKKSYELTNVSKTIMKKVIEKSGLFPYLNN